MPKFVIERPLPGAGKLSSEELRGISQKSNQVLAGLGFGRLTHFLLGFANGGAQALDRLVGLSRRFLHRLPLRAELLQHLAEFGAGAFGPGEGVLQRFDHGCRLRSPL